MSSRNKIYFASLVLIIIVFAIIFFLDMPILASVHKDMQTLQSLKMSLAFLDQRKKNFEDFQTDYEKSKPVLMKADSYLVNYDAPIRFLEFLEREAQLTGVSLKITRIVPSGGKGSLAKNIKFTLYLNGSYPLALRFFKKLEASPYLITVQNIQIRRSVGKREALSPSPRDVVFIINIIVKSK